MQLFLQQCVNGLEQGSIYALFGIGFGLVFSELGILNIAHGSFATWGAIVAFYATRDLHISVWLGLAVGALAAGLIGVFVDTTCFAPLRRRSSRDLTGTMITSVGAWIALDSLAQQVVGPNSTGFSLDVLPGGTVHIGGVLLLPMTIIDISAALVVALGVWLLLHRTEFGATVRAVGHGPHTVAIVGVNTRAAIAGTALLAGAIAGLAGGLAGMTFNNISFSLGDGLLIQGFAAVVIGGVGSVGGTLLGGFAIGVIQVLGAQYISGSFQDAITFSVLLLILFVRPQGIFGELNVERA